MYFIQVTVFSWSSLVSSLSLMREKKSCPKCAELDWVALCHKKARWYCLYAFCLRLALICLVHFRLKGQFNQNKFNNFGYHWLHCVDKTHFINKYVPQKISSHTSLGRQLDDSKKIAILMILFWMNYQFKLREELNFTLMQQCSLPLHWPHYFFNVMLGCLVLMN